MAFNTKQFEYKDITLVVGGEEIVGFTDVKFKRARDKEFLKGRGDKAHGIQAGDVEFTGELKLWQSTYEKLQDKAPDGDITLLEFEVIVMFAKKNTDKISGYRLSGCETTEDELGMASGDKKSEIALPLMFLDRKKIV